jgi:sulfite reductase (NADPH) hemoprotein beta-component
LRLNRLYGENLSEPEILAAMEALFRRFAAERRDGEGLGDFSIRAGLVRPVLNPVEDFHDPL